MDRSLRPGCYIYWFLSRRKNPFQIYDTLLCLQGTSQIEEICFNKPSFHEAQGDFHRTCRLSDEGTFRFKQPFLSFTVLIPSEHEGSLSHAVANSLFQLSFASMKSYRK
ncbi:hypothetical protein CEXT_798051 [Caerostris extrusa]|uniref:Uncharacterized protein n=1 Tax=Caerostris extrusa TaxID=172846 RepID=A0AAV4V765_CAEEX|nr:hypothetical protein CEXT_798051 [Caerostris extrusa]